MERKSSHTPEFEQFVAMLREARAASGLSQMQLAKKVGRDQSIVSRWETGELRMDLVQLRDFCRAIGVSLTDFVADFDQRASTRGQRRKAQPGKRS